MDFEKFEQRFRQPGEAQNWLKPAALGAVVFLVVILISKSFYTVKTNEQAVVLRFGKFHTTSLPGLHFCIPLVDTILPVSIEEHSLRLPGGHREGRPDNLPEDDTLMLTGDLNAGAVEWTVQWKVGEPKDYLFSFYNRYDEDYVEDVISIVSQSVMNRLVGDYSIDEILTEKRTEIAVKARQATQDTLDEYNCGVSITDLQMQRVTPPEKVKPAFAAVNSAVQRRDQLENEANKERNKLLPGAKAESDKLIRAAEGYASRRRAEVTGEISALMAKYKAYQLAPEVTRQRLYLETMERVLTQTSNKTILDSDMNQLLPLMQIEGDK